MGRESPGYQNHGSFKFGNTDMYDTFGIMLIDSGMPEDLFIPSIRERKVEVPNRHGSYDFGAKYYNERELTLKCIAAEPERVGFSMANIRQYVREITYVLSKKAEIRLWNESEKYYVGRLYDATDLIQLRDLADEFELHFICEPFAYGETMTKPFYNRQYIPDYQGTAPTSTYIVIRNTASSGNVTNIKITQIDRKDT